MLTMNAIPLEGTQSIVWLCSQDMVMESHTMAATFNMQTCVTYYQRLAQHVSVGIKMPKKDIQISGISNKFLEPYWMTRKLKRSRSPRTIQ